MYSQIITNGHGFSAGCPMLIPFWVKISSNIYGLLFSVGCSCHFGSTQIITNGQGLIFSVGCSYHFGLNQFKWTWVARAILGHTNTNGYGLLFSVGWSCNLGSNHYKWIWVALYSVGCSCHFGQTITNGHVLLMPFWFKPLQIGMGCSLVWVTHVILS